MSIENTPAAGAKTHDHSATGESATNRAEEIQALDLSADLSAEARRAKAEARRAKVERRILGLELCSDDALREMAIAELAHDHHRFAPVHRLIQAEIEKEHARQVGVIRRAAIAANLRTREEFAEIDVAALLTELASAPFGDAEVEPHSGAAHGYGPRTRREHRPDY